jgi:hypothetical protein
MALTNPSYELKVIRATQHFDELRNLAAPYDEIRPYRVRSRVEGRTGTHIYRAYPAEEPDPWIAVVLGDFLYDLRSALDHMRAALVPPKRSRSGEFPILTEDIWAIDPATGAPAEHLGPARQKWDSSVSGMTPEVLAKIEALQPFRINPDQALHLALAMISRLNNSDKHRELIVVNNFLKPTEVVVTSDGGTRRLKVAAAAEGHLGGHGAVVYRSAKKVKIEAFGPLDIATGGRRDATGQAYRLMDTCETVLRYTAATLDTLRPFART